MCRRTAGFPRRRPRLRIGSRSETVTRLLVFRPNPSEISIASLSSTHLSILARFTTLLCLVGFSRSVAINVWMSIVNESLFEMNAYFPHSVSILLSGFALTSILVSIIPAFAFTTSKKLSEVIREE